MKNFTKTQLQPSTSWSKFSTFLLICLMASGLIFQSCHEIDNSENELAPIGLDLAGLDFHGNLDAINKPFLISGETDDQLQINLDKALSELTLHLEQAEITDYTFKVRRLDKEFELILSSISGKESKGEQTNQKRLCPEGMNRYTTCFLEECVRGAINSLAQNMSAGERIFCT